jgi:flagellar biosynthesis/type III secretory pathway M-ring protein FliF/YscJ
MQQLPINMTGELDATAADKQRENKFTQVLFYQKRIEQELARSVASLQSIRGARVHLALATQTTENSIKTPPRASVLLDLVPGQTLNQSQLAAIVHLLASGVPDLEPEAITIVDRSGELLTQHKNSSAILAAAVAFRNQRLLENELVQRIETILEPIAGRDGVRAQVVAELESSDEQIAKFRPVENNNTHATKARIKHLNITVLINEKQVQGGNGTAHGDRYTDQELQGLTLLIKEAVEFNQARGDVMHLSSVAFFPREANTTGVVWPVWLHIESPFILLVVMCAICLLGLWLWRKLSATGAIQSEMANSSQEKLLSAMSVYSPWKAQTAVNTQSDITVIQDRVRQDPRRAAKVVQNWMAEDA